MRFIRRTLRVFALVGTLIVGMVAFALIVSQTSWFRDWLRRYIVREADQYLNGRLSIGQLTGNLFFGVQLTDVAVEMDGEKVITIESANIDYSVFEIISQGVVLDDIRLNKPVVKLARTAAGWNVGRLVKEQEREKDREGPGRPISIGEIGISDGHITVADSTPAPAIDIPHRIDGLNASLKFAYEPVRFSIGINRLAFAASEPQFAVKNLSGDIAVADDEVYFEGVKLETGESDIQLKGVVEQYTTKPVYRFDLTAGHLSIPEFGRIIPALARYEVRPALELSADGPADRLELEVNARMAEGEIAGTMALDILAPGRRLEGNLQVARLNLAPLVGNQAAASRITGRTEFNLVLPDDRTASPLTGTFHFAGPDVAIFGYQAANVNARGRIDGRKITLDAADAAAYGARATARGTIVTPATPAQQIALNLRGNASRLDLRRLPGALRVPRFESNLVFAYQVSGQPRALDADVELRRSTLEGATIADGTTARVGLKGRRLTYSARGGVADLNVRRVGAKLNVATIATERYDTDLNSEFTLDGSGLSLPELTLEANGTLTNSRLFGGNIPHLQFETLIAKQTLTAKARGSFAGFNPATVTGNARLDGRVAGSANAAVSLAGLGQAFDSGALKIEANGVLTDSELFGGSISNMQFETLLADTNLRAKARGSFAGFNPAELSRNRRLDGRIAGNVDAVIALAGVGRSFDLGALEADGTIVLTDSYVATVGINEGRISAAVRDRVANIREARIAGSAGNLDAKGIVALDDRSQSNLTYQADAVNLEKVGDLLDRPIKGLISLEGQVTGNRTNLTTSGTLSGVNVQYDTTEALALDSKFSVTVPQLDAGQLSLKADSSADLVHVAGRELREVTASTTYTARQLDFDTKLREGGRDLEAAGRVVLHPDHQEVHIRNLSLATQGVRWATPPNSDTAVQYGKDLLTLHNVTLMSGDQSLNVNGTLGLRAGVDGSLDAKASNVDVAQLETLLMQNRGLAGRLTATAHVAGSTAEPKVDGNFSLQNAAFRNYKFESLTGEVDYTTNGVGLDVRLQQNAEEWLTARGTLPMTLFRREATAEAEHVGAETGDSVDLHIQTSTIGLGFIEGFTPHVTQVQGTIQADVRITGSGHDPHPEGYIDLKGGAFRVPLGDASYTGLDTRIELTPDKVLIRGFQILDENGKPLNVAGELAVHEREVDAFDVRITSDDFELIDNEFGDVGINADLRLTGALRRPRIIGNVELSAARFEVDPIREEFAARPPTPEAVVLDERGLPPLDGVELQPTGSPALVAPGTVPVAVPKPLEQNAKTVPGTSVEEERETSTLFEALSLDVSLSIPNNAVLRGSDLRGPAGAPIGLGNLNVTVGGAVNARKAPGESVRLVGQIETVRGTYDFQGRRFDILRDGRIQFQNTADFDPLLDITARRLISGIDARVRIHGTLEQPELELTSIPPMDQGDILSLIVFNQPINQLGEGERISLGARAGELATGFVATPLAREIGRALDVDLFEIQTSAEAGGLNPRVTIGQQFGQRLYVKFSQQFGALDVTRLILEYELADFLRLQTTMSEGSGHTVGSLTQRVEERGGADLVFFFSF